MARFYSGGGNTVETNKLAESTSTAMDPNKQPPRSLDAPAIAETHAGKILVSECAVAPDLNQYCESDQSALAVYARASVSAKDADMRARSLYRRWLKNADHIVSLYYLDLPAALVRQKVRQEFEKSKYITDLGTRDVLLWKGHLELQETLNLWKQKTHVMRYFENAQYGDRSKDVFMNRFLSGRN